MGAAGRIALPDVNARTTRSVAACLPGQCLIIPERWYNIGNNDKATGLIRGQFTLPVFLLS